MPNYVFAYHGGKAPESPEDGAKVMAEWRGWFEKMGSAVVNPGNPVGMSKTVTAKGISDDGGANPLSGFSVVSASSMDAAVAMAQGCPIIKDVGGSVEVAEVHEM